MEKIETWLTEPLILSEVSLLQHVVVTAFMVGWFGVYRLLVAALLAWYTKLRAYPGTADEVAHKTAPRGICLISTSCTFMVLCFGMAFGGGLTEARVLNAQIIAGLMYQSAFLFDLVVNAKTMKWTQALHHIVVQVVVQYVFGGPRYRVVYAICLMAPALSTFYELLVTIRTILPSVAGLRMVKKVCVVGASVSLAIIIILQILHVCLRLKRCEFVITLIVLTISIPWISQDFIVLQWMMRFDSQRAVTNMRLSEKMNNIDKAGCVQI